MKNYRLKIIESKSSTVELKENRIYVYKRNKGRSVHDLLVNWYKEPNHGSPKALHFTEGGPWFENYRFCDYHQYWKDTLSEMMDIED